ncbi:amino acid synthesis family protein [Paraburkholderia sp. BL10I2N1]|uniref:amino acid synthesis family protein n=1 Tax=Paraburkholderia sp. BL10I2N1 TaxID=1938796 RepID=UPI0010612782|nr:amino acid synthesis family protein [Paraburkholderia sp. BL10I2N1]TDN67147.1 amino acid synthesis protein [Paraburkholderia sp. BL10I2N1]
MQIRRLVVWVVERHAEHGLVVVPPHRQVAAAAVLGRARAGNEGPLEPLYELGAELGTLLTHRAMDALSVGPSDVQSYGKAALVGTGIALECGAALLHPRLGKAVRQCLPGASTIMPSVTKRGGPGACVDIPLHSTTDAWSFDHFDTVSLVVPDAPAPDEILIAVGLADRGRPLACVKG